MAVNTDELIRALSILADNENIQVTVQESAKGAAICGISALVGALLMGPRGLAVGGTVGAIAAYGLSEGKFKPLGEVIANDLSESDRKALKNHVVKAITDVRPIDVVNLVGLIMRNQNISDIALNAVKSFATQRMGLTIVN